MANHDPISDMLTRIRNASEKRHQSTKVPASRMSRSIAKVLQQDCLLYTSPSPRDPHLSRMPSSA